MWRKNKQPEVQKTTYEVKLKCENCMNDISLFIPIGMPLGYYVSHNNPSCSICGVPVFYHSLKAMRQPEPNQMPNQEPMREQPVKKNVEPENTIKNKNGIPSYYLYDKGGNEEQWS